MLTGVATEVFKMRRLRVGLVAAVLTAATWMFSAMQLFSDSYRPTLLDPHGEHWASLLLGYALTKALTAPLLVAVLASRQVDMEHQGNGWTMAAANGVPRGRLCLIKILVLAGVVVLVTAAELGGLILASLVLGAQAALPIGLWAWYAASSAAITIALLAAHVWLAARVENQLVVLAVGVVGAFAGMFAMLMPSWLAHALPWGYYAVAMPFRMTLEGVEPVPLEWPAVLAFLLVMSGAVWFGLRTLDKEISR